MMMTVNKPPPLPQPARPRRWRILRVAMSAVAFNLAPGFHIELAQAASPGSI
jgi:hypothetical protein